MWVTMHHLLMSSFAVSQDTAWDDVMEAWIDRIWCHFQSRKVGGCIVIYWTIYWCNIFSLCQLLQRSPSPSSPLSSSSSTGLSFQACQQSPGWDPCGSDDGSHRTPNQCEWHKMKANTIRSNKSFISLFPTYIPPQKKTDVFEVATLLGQITLFSLSSSGGYHVYIHIYIYTNMCVLIVVLLLNPGTSGIFFTRTVCKRLQTTLAQDSRFKKKLLESRG